MTLPYAHHVFVCTNRRPDGHPRGSCAARGSEALRDALKAEAKKAGLSSVRVNASGCLDFCEQGPVVCLYPENRWYGGVKAEDIAGFVAGPLAGNSDGGLPRLSDAVLRRGADV